MKKKNLIFATSFVLLATASTVFVRADDKDDKEGKLVLAEVPPVALQAAQAAAPGSKPDHASIEDGGGMKVYEIAFETPEAKTITVSVMADGTVVETSQVVKGAAIPAGVAATIKGIIPTAADGKVEKRTVVFYETKKQIDGKNYRLSVDGAGRVVSFESED